MLLMMVVVLALMMGPGVGPMGMMGHAKPEQSSTASSVEKSSAAPGHEHSAPKTE